MIALIGVSSPVGQEKYVAVLTSLPSPPALPHSGFLVKCGGLLTAARVLPWFARVRADRPGVCLGLICDPTPRELSLITGCAFPIAPFLLPSDTPDNTLPESAVNVLRGRTLEGWILERWAGAFVHLAGADLELLSTIVECGVRGGTLESVARQLSINPKTVTRRLRRLTQCGGKCLLRRARVDFVSAQLDLGASLSVALASANLSSPQAFEMLKERDQARRNRGTGCPRGSGHGERRCPFSIAASF
jgi:hypothetical protein